MIASHSPFHSAHVASHTPASHRSVEALAAAEKGATLESQVIPAVGSASQTAQFSSRFSSPNHFQSPSSGSATAQEASTNESASGVVQSDEQLAQAQEAKARIEKAELQQMQRQIAALAARDREVRAHEQAHMAVGGQYAGAAKYQYERGPDGVNYAVGGEVPIDVGREANPQATIDKARTVRRAALAPADPSPQDRKVAALATQMEREALQELNELRRAAQAEQKEARQSATEGDSENAADGEGTSGKPSTGTEAASPTERRSPFTREPSGGSISSGLASPASFAQQRQVGQLSTIQSLASPTQSNVLDELV